MFDVGAGEMVFIFIAALLLFGPKKIPEVAQMVGRGLREFRRAQDGLRAQIREVTSEIEDPFSDKPVQRTVIHTEPALQTIHEPEAPGQISLLDTPLPEQTVEQPELLKPLIKPAEGAIARPGRQSSPPPEATQSE